MTTDGNHPTIEVSYLQAYYIYTALAPESSQKATYIPAGLGNESGRTTRAHRELRHVHGRVATHGAAPLRPYE